MANRESQIVHLSPNGSFFTLRAHLELISLVSTVGNLDNLTLTNAVIGSNNLYTGEVEWSSFDYRLSIAASSVFVALFSISLGESSTLLLLSQPLLADSSFPTPSPPHRPSHQVPLLVPPLHPRLRRSR